MTTRSDLVARSDLAIFGNLGDPAAVLTPADGSAVVTGPALLRRPGERDVLAGGLGMMRSANEIHAPRSAFPVVRKNDVWTLDDGYGDGVHNWQVTEAPDRSPQGAIWICAVRDLGAA